MDLHDVRVVTGWSDVHNTSQHPGPSRVLAGRVEGALPHQPALPEHAEHLEARTEGLRA